MGRVERTIVPVVPAHRFDLDGSVARVGFSSEPIRGCAPRDGETASSRSGVTRRSPCSSSAGLICSSSEVLGVRLITP